jgi:hypothetical protein
MPFHVENKRIAVATVTMKKKPEGRVREGKERKGTNVARSGQGVLPLHSAPVRIATL